MSERGQNPLSRRLRVAALLFVAVVLVLLGITVAVSFGARWGCPSQAELERARSQREVVAAFADRGVRLSPTGLPRAFFGDDKSYRGVAAYRHVTRQAALFVLVCEARCLAAPLALPNEIEVAPGARQRLRQFSTLGNNIAVFVTDTDRRSGRRLNERIGPVLNDLDAAHDSDSRCYVG